MSDLESLEETLNAFNEWVSKDFGALIQQFAERAIEISRLISDALSTAYREAGQPYGDSREGMMRWLEEINEAGRLYHQAQQILQRHQELVAFRRLGERIRENNSGK